MKRKFSITKRLKSFVYAGKGIWDLFSYEHNAWIHGLAVVLVTTAGFYFSINRYEWISLILCFAMVLAAEAVNTAIERLTDLVSPTHHRLAGETKDLAAGAVLICAIAAVIVGIMVFMPYVSAWIQ